MPTPFLHLTNLLAIGGTAKIMMNFAAAADTAHFTPVLVGLGGDEDFVAILRERGFRAAIVGENLEGLGGVLPPDVPFVAVVHRAGQREAAWDRSGPILARLGAGAVIECNIFGNSDGGAGDAWRDGVFCYAAQTLWRHWVAMGRPDLDWYLGRHRLIYNPVAPPPSREELAGLRRDLRRDLGIPEDAFVIGDVCRPAPEKLDAMLAAILPRLLREIPDMHVVVRRFPDCMAGRISRRIGKRFHNLPLTKDESELAATYAVMDVFAHFSTMGESFGMAIAEAMRIGLPVVANETPGAWNNNAQGELVQHDVTGFLANSCRAGTTHIVALARSPGRRAEMGKAAQEHFDTPIFTASGVTNQLESWAAAIAWNKGIKMVTDWEPSPWLPDPVKMKRDLLSYRDIFTVPKDTLLAAFPCYIVPEAQRLAWRLQRKLR